MSRDSSVELNRLTYWTDQMCSYHANIVYMASILFSEMLQHTHTLTRSFFFQVRQPINNACYIISETRREYLTVIVYFILRSTELVDAYITTRLCSTFGTLLYRLQIYCVEFVISLVATRQDSLEVTKGCE